jgi:hypothetical protein
MAGIRAISGLVLLLAISACDDECSEYSDFNCEEIEAADYNVYFYYPSEREKYIGQVSTLSSCGETAYDYAYSKSLSDNDGWSYICCMKTEESSCYEKHR